MSAEFPKTAALKSYEKIRDVPGGKLVFSKIISRRAPYFKSIDPRILELRPNYMEASLRKRKAVTNHIGTVHAIAMCNLCEYTGGTLMEISRPNTTRWIPRGMQVQYLAKAET
ncbi:hotdog fold domain-containing protein, partial [Litorivivens sp.]|uniref:hotdog fold domain-containing protein n=1 Tax=Litorivivens sp. TaxID=2020868 RepID=UPI00356A47DF